MTEIEKLVDAYGGAMWTCGRAGDATDEIDDDELTEDAYTARYALRELLAAVTSLPFSDPYQGAREDLLDWKRQAQKLQNDLDAEKGAHILTVRLCKELQAATAASNQP